MGKVEVTGKRIVQGRLYRSRSRFLFGRFGLEYLPFVLLYAVLLFQCYMTIGDQFQRAVEKAERDGRAIPMTARSLRDAGQKVLANGLESDKDTGGWWIFSGFNEQSLEEQEKEKEERPIRLPSRYLPGFWPLLGLGFTVTLNILLVLLQVWSVRFKCFVRFREVDSVTTATHIHITPARTAGGGKPALVPLQRKPGSALGTWFVYARRNYAWDSRSRAFVKIRCKADYPLVNYTYATGLSSEAQMRAAREKYGANRCVLDMPTFGELYVQQLLSPIVVFQVFSNCLWLLDEYWKYSTFSIFMIFVFESTVVFSRLKSLQTLRNMGSGSKPVFVYRKSRWSKISSEDLLPGDLVSLSLQDTSGANGSDADKPGDADADADSKNEDDNSEADLVPCDALILAGSAVVNESSLTGESIPQMKAGLKVDLADPQHSHEALNIKGAHKTHVLFGGTRLLQAKAALEDPSDDAEQDEEDELHGDEDSAGEHEDDDGQGEEEDEEDDDADDDEDDDEDDTQVEEQSTLDASEGGGELELASQQTSIVGSLQAPDNGCVCYVLRTGFSSSQGKLVRMIEGSADTKSVRGNDRDTALLLLLLLFFAVTSSGYVLYKGIGDESRSQYQLLLHCILIITSVIPPELPMQTALAVNTALMTLMKMQLFCTEPFRLPIAGHMDTCLFDKTGTLTTDELVAVGVVPPNGVRREDFDKTTSARAALKSSKTEESKEPTRRGKRSREAREPAPSLKPTTYEDAKAANDVLMLRMLSTTPEALAVLVGCHSLVRINGKVAGDPLEAASLKAVRWTIEERPSQGSKGKETTRCLPQTKDGTVVAKGIRLYGQPEAAYLEVVGRHHFSSKLQRMSTVVRASTGAHYVLCKGSPEVIGARCTQESLGAASWYQDTSAKLAKQGMRVIALAMKSLSASAVEDALDSRARAEEELNFVGFVAFTCRVRKDSRKHIEALKEGGHHVLMVTGDAVLTGIHVARDVSMTRERPEEILLLKTDKKSSKTGWWNYDTNEYVQDFAAHDIPALARRYSLCVTGTSFNAVREASGGVGGDLDRYLHLICVYARMRPDDKESILTAMKAHGRKCLMCGDGANDVGALKQAHVGVALLSGFGDLNVERSEEEKEASKEVLSKGKGTTALMTKADADALAKLPIKEIKAKLLALNVDPARYPQCVEKADLIRLYRAASQKAAREAHDAQDEAFQPGTAAYQRRVARLTPAQRKAEARRRQQEQMEKRKQDFQEELERLQQAGDPWASWNAIKNVWSKEMEKSKKAAKERTGAKGFANSASKLAAQMDDLEDGALPMVKLGDASIAAPFTSRMPSIRGCVDIIRQGRCTLVTSLQMYQILALNCLINAYSLSVLYLDGVKLGDYQMTCIGILMSISYITISRSKPLVKLSPQRPFASIFHPALFMSMVGQFLLHLFSMMWAKNEARKFLPDEYAPDLEGKFKPNMLNTVVFLVTIIQQVSVFVVNLKGPPFMTGLEENSPLLYSLIVTFGFAGVCATELSPQLNKFLKLVPFPTLAFRNQVLGVLAAEVGLAFIWDRLCVGLFAPKVLKASFEGVKYRNIVKALFWVGVLFYMMSGMDWDELEKQLEEAESAEGLAEDGVGAAEVANDTVSVMVDSLGQIDSDVAELEFQ
mmetsp:Transcript_4844/g.19377  ORF Transcript_4844/g.19377 Transcript_4844/m.19377 type:complete len:1638 (-) Transcript_4844:108-5021(-)